MDNKSKELHIAIEAAKKGAQMALKYYKSGKDLDIKLKQDTSSVTIADLETEKQIKEYISASFPDANFIAEETENRNRNFENVWIIDPIDGTTEFTKGIDLWGILVANAVSGEVIVGVCYFPALDTLLYAEKNSGAYVNGVKIKVSNTPSLSKALFGFSSIKYFKESEKETLLKVISHGWSARGFNSSFSMYGVASGKLDFFISSSHNTIWDNAPFIRIISEAGGKVTDWMGRDIDIRNQSSNLIASNGIVHDEILKLINGK